MAAVFSSAYYGAPAYLGPAELTPARAFTSWTVDLPVLIVVLLAGGLYLAGMRRARGSGQRWPAGRAVAFWGGGLGAVAVATMSFIGVYQGTLFYVRSVQTILLLLVAPLFLTLGRPLSLAVAVLPGLGPRLEAGVRSSMARILTFPAITTMAVIFVPFLLYFSPWYAASLHNDLLREVTYLALLAPGFVFFWTLLRLDPVPRAYPYLVALWVSGAEVVGDAILGLAVIADQHLIAGAYYHALARPWGPSLSTDQVLGGGVLWILGDIVGLPFLAVQLIQMIREDEAGAVAIDAELDAAETAQPGGAQPGSARPGPAAGPAETLAEPGAARGEHAGGSQPWWESDPRFADRFRSAGDP